MVGGSASRYARLARRAPGFVAGILIVFGVALGPVGAEDRVAAPGHRLEVVVTGVPYVLDALEPFRGVLLVAVGAPSPGSRLLRFTLRRDAPEPLHARGGEPVLWSRVRLSPLITYSLTGRVHAGAPEQGRVVQLSSDWEPETLIVGLEAVRDLAFRTDGRLLIADGTRILQSPVYVAPTVDAGRLAALHRCRGACRGVAVSPAGEVFVLEADEEGGRVIALGPAGATRVVAAGLPRPGDGLRLGRRGDLFFISEAGVLRVRSDGTVVRILAGVPPGARLNLDPDGNLLVTDPAAGKVAGIRVPAE